MGGSYSEEKSGEENNVAGENNGKPLVKQEKAAESTNPEGDYGGEMNEHGHGQEEDTNAEEAGKIMMELLREGN